MEIDISKVNDQASRDQMALYMMDFYKEIYAGPVKKNKFMKFAKALERYQQRCAQLYLKKDQS